VNVLANPTPVIVVVLITVEYTTSSPSDPESPPESVTSTLASAEEAVRTASRSDTCSSTPATVERTGRTAVGPAVPALQLQPFEHGHRELQPVEPFPPSDTRFKDTQLGRGTARGGRHRPSKPDSHRRLLPQLVPSTADPSVASASSWTDTESLCLSNSDTSRTTSTGLSLSTQDSARSGHSDLAGTRTTVSAVRDGWLAGSYARGDAVRGSAQRITNRVPMRKAVDHARPADASSQFGHAAHSSPPGSSNVSASSSMAVDRGLKTHEGASPSSTGSSVKGACPFKIHCARGRRCRLQHTAEEVELFHMHPTTHFQFWKVQPCEKAAPHEARTCPFAHSEQERWCLNCKSAGHATAACPTRGVVKGPEVSP